MLGLINSDTKYISQIECGLNKGSINMLLKLCTAYHVTPNDILHNFIKDLDNDNDMDEFYAEFSKLRKRDRKIILKMIHELNEMD